MDQLKRLFRLLLDFIALWYGRIFHPDDKGRIPEVEDSVLLLRATQLSEQIKKRKLKAEDVIKTYFERIQETNPLINAVIEIRHQALDDARKIDKKLAEEGDEARNEDGVRLLDLPLLGVPFTCKDSWSIAGMHLVVGLQSRKNELATEDSAAIRNLRKSGGIPIALTNVPELLMWWDAHNTVFGRTRNPYDLSRIPGGSAGGDGAALATCSSVIAVGSDIGGSVRLPAFHCGVFGHKTSKGVIKIDGRYPPHNPDRECLLGAGPMTRYATDLKVMLKIMAGDGIKNLPKIDSTVDIAKCKVYYMEGDEDPLKSPLHPEMRQALRKLVYHLEEKFGIKCVKHNFDEFKYGLAMLKASLLEANSTPMSSLMTEGKGQLNPFLELLKFVFGLSEHSLGAICVAISDKTTPPLSSPLQKMNLEVRDNLKVKFLELLGDSGIFLYPAFPETATKHGTTVLKVANVAYMSIFNVLGVPVTSCPMGLASDGLPLGVQVAAMPNNDHLTLAVAEEIERTFGGWVPPCIVPNQG